MSVRKGFSFNPKYLAIGDYKGTPKTTFSFGDKIRNSPTNSYQNYKFTVWGEALDITEKDKVTIEQIDDISISYYNGKNYFNISGKVSVLKQGAEVFMPDKIPEVYVPLANADENFSTITEEETVCPFDM
jgi:hypothetical protein